MEFQVTHKLTYRDFVVLNQVQDKTKRRVFNIIIRILGIVVGALIFGGTLILYSAGEMSKTDLVYSLIGVVIILMCIFPSHFDALFSQKLTPFSASEMEISFKEDVIVGKAKGIVTQYPYDFGFSLYHMKERYFLRLGKRQMIVIPEHSFTYGDPSKFADFLEQKTGQRIQYFK